MQPKVGIILINYKDYAKRFLADCRDSLRLIDYPKDKYVVYIVDNATSPETRAYLQEIYPEAVVIPNLENSGWGGGNNLGIEQSFKDGCEDVVLANMDVIVHKDWLKELVSAAYSDSGQATTESGLATNPSDSKIGIAQSKLLLWPVGSDGVQRINSLGNEIHFLGFGYCRGYGEENRDVSNFVTQSLETSHFPDIPYASGASMYVKGEVFRKIGLCNPAFFMYHDDLEICLKAKCAGYRVVLAPASVMWHKYEFGRSVRQIYYMERNRLITVLEFYKISTLILLAPMFSVMELGLLGSSLAGRYDKAKLRSWAYFWHFDNWKKIFQERRRIQRLRTIKDSELMRDFTGKILFQEIANPVLRYFVNPVFNAYWQVAKRLMWW
ncbi:MAG: Glycosyl transferase family 2 [Parcubacteria group bacterium GW2011_GWC2_45_7]|nr:MAG: Glycosyl transferase family 2 [Parcubacteria group bacterium GW2011_GWC2_45_7]KKU73700.1 MAG: Glycosyl transferase family 2 [Parcubacteria group bacterium GW2011_GWA2_47_26]